MISAASFQLFSTTRERTEYAAQIRDNVRQVVRALIGAMETLEIDLADEDNREFFEYVSMQKRNSVFDDSQTDFATQVKRFWTDAGVQRCFQRSAEFLLTDSAQ